MRDQLFHLQPDGKSTLQAQLRRMLVEAILDGQVPAGSALPSCRRMAQNLRIARNTVALAYQDLVEEGFLVARQRSGYFVVDPDSTPERRIFNRTVTLRDTWGKIEKQEQ